jgi:hypothetical protein
VARQIGNAVPPKLAEAVARSIIRHLSTHHIERGNAVDRHPAFTECI